MIAVLMVPASAFGVGMSYSAYLLAAAMLGVVFLAAYAEPLPKKLARGVAVAATVAGVFAVFANIIIMCSDWIWCWW